jgi:hypothetical protein
MAFANLHFTGEKIIARGILYFSIDNSICEAPFRGICIFLSITAFAKLHFKGGNIIARGICIFLSITAFAKLNFKGENIPAMGNLYFLSTMAFANLHFTGEKIIAGEILHLSIDNGLCEAPFQG